MRQSHNMYWVPEKTTERSWVSFAGTEAFPSQPGVNHSGREQGYGPHRYFHIIPYKLVRVKFRGVRRQKKQLQFSTERIDIAACTFGAVRWMTIHDQENPTSPTLHQSLEKFYEHPSTHAPRTTMNRRDPFGLIAEIIFRLKRCPVTRTTGVFPRGAQVVPLWKSERTPDSSSKNISAPSRLAMARIRGYSLFNHCSTKEGFCW